MKKNIKNKKYFTLVVIVLALFTGFVIQSCQTDDTANDKMEAKTTINQREKKIIAKKFQNYFLRKAEKLTAITNKNQLILNRKSSNTKEIAKLKIETLNELKPLILESKSFLKKYNNLSDEDLLKISNGKNEECFIILSMAILAKEKEKQKIASDNDINLQSLLLMQNANAEIEWYEVGNCALEAIGADVLIALGTEGAAAWTVASITSAFTSIAKKSLGPIGVAVAVGVFTYCLVQADNND